MIAHECWIAKEMVFNRNYGKSVENEILGMGVTKGVIEKHLRDKSLFFNRDCVGKLKNFVKVNEGKFCGLGSGRGGGVGGGGERSRNRSVEYLKDKVPDMEGRGGGGVGPVSAVQKKNVRTLSGIVRSANKRGF